MEDKEEPISSVYLEPPPPSYETDEDDATEDTGGALDHLPPRMLTSNGSAELFDGQQIGAIDDDASDDETIIDEPIEC